MTSASEPPLDLESLRQRLIGGGGDRFWRSLEEAAETPEFREMLAREFAVPLPMEDLSTEAAQPGSLELTARRDFLKYIAASLALAGVTGCSSAPSEKIVPYVRAPEEIVPGKPLFYATAFTLGGYALGVLAESHMGRPTKIEGNPEHPASLGATDAMAQASVLGLYDPDRSQTLMYRGRIAIWDQFLTAMGTALEELKGRHGRGLAILTETVTSPTLAAQLAALREMMPEFKWHQFDPFGRHHAYSAAQTAFGKPVDTIYRFDRADVILSLGSDFLTELPGSVRYTREFIDRRRVADGVDKMNRLYVVESSPTCTGVMADHRLRLAPRDIQRLARAVAEQKTSGVSIPGVPDVWLRTLLADLQQAGGRSLVIAGEAEPPIVHVLAHAINRSLGNVGQTVEYIEPVAAAPVDQLKSLSELIDRMQAGNVETLVILGGNPVYNTPGEMAFTAALAKVKNRIHLSSHYDETSFLCDWHLPAAHELESWSDARAFDGTVTILQPLIAPLYEGRTMHEVLALLLGQSGQSAYQIVEASWRQRLGEENFSRVWRRALHDGVVADTASAAANAPWQLDELPADAVEAESAELVLIIHPDPSVYDGRFANNAWLQELPKPLTKITWDNALHISPATAERLGLTSNQMVAITAGERTISAPVWILPGHADDCATLAAGYGRTMAGHVGSNLGCNAQSLRSKQHRWTVGVSLRATGEFRTLPTTQAHHSMEGRDLVRVASHASYLKDPQQWEHGPHAATVPSLLGQQFAYEGNAWGMVIDQTACVGCNACVTACQAENNIPVVGPEQVANGRAMHWLRIDRYYRGALDEPQTYFQPVLCMQCEQAPCELVCPVAATVHSAEGLNDMIYNRCVGTRYCSNNCPYKVRRFNYLKYTDDETPSLKLLRNPDVTVRSRGVMEKCTYCVQRINVARIDAKKENREIRDGEIVTACQAACPARAITFGNINDQQSQVQRLKELPLNYSLLAELNTRPRTTYLARITNPHPDLAAPEGPHHEP